MHAFRYFAEVETFCKTMIAYHDSLWIQNMHSDTLPLSSNILHYQTCPARTLACVLSLNVGLLNVYQLIQCPPRGEHVFRIRLSPIGREMYCA
jgi:hypothetical protein